MESRNKENDQNNNNNNNKLKMHHFATLISELAANQRPPREFRLSLSLLKVERQKRKQ